MEKKTIDRLGKAIFVWGCYILGYILVVKFGGWILAIGVFLVTLGVKGEDLKIN